MADGDAVESRDNLARRRHAVHALIAEIGHIRRELIAPEDDEDDALTRSWLPLPRDDEDEDLPRDPRP